MSGTTIGQWARRGLIRASVSAGRPHVYAVEDVGEASIVAELLRRGLRHDEIRHAVEQLDGSWPLGKADLATTTSDTDPTQAPRLVLDGTLELDPRGWQTLAIVPGLRLVAIRLRPSDA